MKRPSKNLQSGQMRFIMYLRKSRITKERIKVSRPEMITLSPDYFFFSFSRLIDYQIICIKLFSSHIEATDMSLLYRLH